MGWGSAPLRRSRGFCLSRSARPGPWAPANSPLLALPPEGPRLARTRGCPACCQIQLVKTKTKTLSQFLLS